MPRRHGFLIKRKEDTMTDKRQLVFEVVLAAIILGGMVLLAGLWK